MVIYYYLVADHVNLIIRYFSMYFPFIVLVEQITRIMRKVVQVVAILLFFPALLLMQ